MKTCPDCKNEGPNYWACCPQCGAELVSKADTPAQCRSCHKPMTPEENCGGDCRACMAEAGDPDCLVSPLGRNDPNRHVKVRQNHYGKWYFPTISKCAVCGGVNGCGATEPNSRETHWHDRELAHQYALLEHGYYMSLWTTIGPDGTHHCNVANAPLVPGKCDCECNPHRFTYEPATHTQKCQNPGCGVVIGIPDSSG